MPGGATQTEFGDRLDVIHATEATIQDNPWYGWYMPARTVQSYPSP